MHNLFINTIGKEEIRERKYKTKKLSQNFKQNYRKKQIQYLRPTFLKYETHI